MIKEILIQKCLLIIKEIEERSEVLERTFYICIHSSVEGACEEIVPLLIQYGFKYIECFDLDDTAFWYGFSWLYYERYNNTKIEHIISFIAWLEAGNSVEDLYLKEETK